MPDTPPAPRSSYLHVPFCARRCGYCNFAVVADRLDLADDYLRAVAIELDRTPGVHEVETLYFGGGTPTELPTDKLAALCDTITARRPLAEGHEWTVEANPTDVSEPLVEMLAAKGVTRVSLGAQSLDGAKLVALERNHARNDVSLAVQRLHNAGLAVAVDLIFAAPGETLDGWIADLQAVIAMRPEHVSTYGLTYEPGAPFWGRLQRGELAERPEELQLAMYTAAIDRLAEAGYEHYEISNFSQPGQRSRHNEAYWLGRQYFAEGPGAARHVGGARETNHRSTTTYLRRVLDGGSPVAEREELTDEQRARERLVFGLRRLEGVTRGGFARETGHEINTLAGPAITRFVEQGMLADDGKTIRLTREGLMISDSLWPELI